MGPDEKNTGRLAVYMDGQPVGIAYGEIQEISLVAEEPAEAMAAGRDLRRVHDHHTGASQRGREVTDGGMGRGM